MIIGLGLARQAGNSFKNRAVVALLFVCGRSYTQSRVKVLLFCSGVLASLAGDSAIGLTVRANFLTIDSMNGKRCMSLLVPAHGI